MRIINIILSILFYTTALATETRSKIGIIDTGLRVDSKVAPYICEDGLKDFTSTTMYDYVGHGTNIAGIITNNISHKNYCIVMIKYTVDYSGTTNNYIQALAYAASANLKFLNLSLSGKSPLEKERELLIKIGNAGTVISISSGNDSLNLSQGCNVYPACYAPSVPNMYVVSAKDAPWANIKGPVNSYQNGTDVCGFGICLSGTSQAAAVFMNKMISMGSKLGGGNKNENTEDIHRQGSRSQSSRHDSTR